MINLITTLERKEDLPALLASAADTILVSVRGLSSSCAQPLSPEERTEVSAKVKAAGKRLAILANITLHEDMVAPAEQLMADCSAEDHVSVFFADPALFYMAKKYDMVSHMVYEPETLMTSSPDGEWWISRGVEGVCISPLLTLKETVSIASTVKKAIVTVHGRTLMSRSYRKLLTAYKDQNHLEQEVTGNRRLYIVEKQREGNMPIFEDETGTLIYSDDILDSFDFIDQIIESKPIAFLINGSYMDLNQQLASIEAYKKILDGTNASTVGKEYREQFSSEPLDSGYYEQKTVK